MLSMIKDELLKFGIKDFIDLDVMLWHIYEDILPTISHELETKSEKQTEILEKPTPTITIDSHAGAQFHLLELGNMLGFLTYTPDPSSTYNDHKLGEVATLKIFLLLQVKEIFGLQEKLM